MARADVEPGPEVAEPRLLHADEERLRLVAATLARGGRFVLIVADSELWQAAERFLRELMPDHVFVERSPATSDEASCAISDPLRNDPRTTIVIRITGRDAGPIETLNLRRESLTEAAANFLVVLEGNEAHRRFLQEAPDCYSYRDVLAVLEGEPSFEAPKHELYDNDSIVNFIDLVRRQVDPLGRIALLKDGALKLQRNGQEALARKLVDEAIAIVTALDDEPDERRRVMLVELYWLSTVGRSRSERYHLARRALEVLAPIADQYSGLYSDIEAQLVDAIGIDLEAARDAVQRARDHGSSLGVPLMGLALAYCARVNLVRAREILAEAEPDASVRDFALWAHFRVLGAEGAWATADRLVSSAQRSELERSPYRVRLDRARAKLLMLQGEGRAAQRHFEMPPSDIEWELVLVLIAAEGGRMSQATSQIESMLERSQRTGPSNIANLLDIHDALACMTELDIAMGGSALTREALDSRLTTLRLYIERSVDSDPPWDLIDCLLLQSDAYLRRLGAEQLALQCAEEAWKLADRRATVMAASVAMRPAVASLRLGDLDQAREWLARGLARASEHEHRGDEAHLRGLAFWHATLAGDDVDRAETDMRAAIAATGSLLVEASVLARVGSALARHDLLRRAQQIYRSLPWPVREGACLEALGETRIAEARYRTFELVARLKILERRAGPPPITAVDDFR